MVVSRYGRHPRTTQSAAPKPDRARTGCVSSRFKRRS